MRARQLTGNLGFPFPLAAMATWDKERNLKSARALRALEPQLLAVGHGAAFRDPGGETVRAIERADRALA